MKMLSIILQIGILFVFSFVGNVIHDVFNLIIPGSIIGFLLLFLCLCLKVVPVHFIENGAGFLLRLLMLFFIPSTVGIINYPSLLSLHGAWFFLAVLFSTVLSMVIAGKAGQFFEIRAEKRKDDKECNSISSNSV